jgi:spermidine/putrescine transport system permease protein
MGVFTVFWAMRNWYVRRVITHFYLNLMLPEIIIAVGLLRISVLLGIPLGPFSLIIAHTVLGLGYVIPLVYDRYQELDKRLMEAALDLGASPFTAFVSVILPLLRTTIFAAATLVFIISFDDFVCAYFCAGNTFQTLPLYILSMLRVGISPEVGALSTVLLGFCSVLVMVYAILISRKQRGT